jgi:hypothetical protein
MFWVRLIWNGAERRVPGSDDNQDIVCEDEIVEILEFDKSLAPAHIIQSAQGLVAAEAKVEDAHVGVVASNIANDLLDCLVVEFDDGNLADPFCERGDYHIKKLALARRRNVSRTAGIEVPKNHTRCNPRGVIIGDRISSCWVAELATSIAGKDRVPSWNARIHDCNGWEVGACRWREWGPT